MTEAGVLADTIASKASREIKKDCRISVFNDTPKIECRAVAHTPNQGYSITLRFVFPYDSVMAGLCRPSLWSKTTANRKTWSKCSARPAGRS